MDYNKTLNLPKTNFPMRANLPEREPEIQRFWEEKGIYQRVQAAAKAEGRPSFILHDGPPYANGHIHIGTALNKTLKDIVVRFKAMDGYYTPYVHGWDTHGLPIEQRVIKERGLDRHTMGAVDFRQACREFALKFKEIQQKEFARLGVWGNWEDSYLTLMPKYEAKQIEIFGEMAKKGYIYKGRKPVYWCATCETALAEAEIEYADHRSPSIYIRFPVVDARGFFPADGAYAVIWTTTPWTLPANLAICLHPEFEYALVAAESGSYLVASGLLESFADAVRLGSYTVRARFKGAELEGIRCRHPFINRESPCILGTHVTLEQGTGCVHTAPGHGLEDYEVGTRYGLEIYAPVGPKGTFTEEAGKYAGMTLEEANPAIVADLEVRGALMASAAIVHQYPHCWRCKRPVVFRATEQWFASVSGFRQEALAAVKTVRWIPDWGEVRIANMIALRNDWCISRQRTWGVPIPVFYCTACGRHIINDRTIARVREIFAIEGSDAWYARPVAELVPPGLTCPACGAKEFRKETDIMDVWFDSGSSHAAVLEQWPDLSWPADLYLEGSDQHRGWFQSSLLTAVAARGQAPFRTVLTHGYVVDAEGQKMSKSLGNVTAPEEIIKHYGADILRLWVASSDYTSDIRISGEMLKQLAEIYRRIRNTCRFLLANLGDFTPETDRMAKEELTELDCWALLELERVYQHVSDAYRSYQFHLVYHALHNYCTVELSSIYLDVLKDRLYVSAPRDPQRRAAQTVLHEILVTLTGMLAPILVHTMEEIWQSLPGRREESVQLALWPRPHPERLDAQLEARWERLLAMRRDVAKALESARNDRLIGGALEAEVALYAPAEYAVLLKDYGLKDLAALYLVSSVRLAEGSPPPAAVAGENVPGLCIAVARAPGAKCERCWNYRTEVSQDAEHPGLCHRCRQVLDEMGQEKS